MDGSSTLAVMSDIHGNADALRAVLDDIAARGVTRIVCLGDHLSGPLAAAETAEILMASTITAISGNHDRWLVESDPATLSASDSCALAQLGRGHLDWLASLPATLRVSDDIFLCHGTPDSDTTYWMEEVSPTGQVSLRSREGIEAQARNINASLFLCGHTHITRRVDIGQGRTVLNPGSVGCPAYTDDHPVPHVMQTGSPAASYALVNRTATGWMSEFRQVPYDPARMIGLAHKAGRDDWVQALKTGWLS